MTDQEKLPCHGKFCRRPGLPLLPVRVAYVPKGFDSLPDSIAKSPYAEAIYKHFTDGKAMLRVISEGYVFTYDPRPGMGWRAFAATKDGRFREVIVADAERPHQQPVFGCSRKGDNIEASLINVELANEAHQDVWVGYTRVWWTKTVRKQMLADSELRDVFMVSINAKALYGGANPSPQVGFRLDAAGKALGTVLEYLPFHATTEQLYANTTSKVAVDRSAEAAPLAARMREKSNQHEGVVLALPDIVGLAMDTACWRNICAGTLTHYQVAEADTRAHMVRDIVLGIKHSMEKNGQADEWADRYASKVDMGKLQADKQKYEHEVEKRAQPIYRASTDWISVVMRKSFRLAWQAYDGEPHDIGLAFEHDFAQCIVGSGALEEEGKWWQPWLLAAPDDKQHPLWRALAAGDKDTVDFLREHASDGLDLYKNTKEGSKEFKEWLEKRQSHGLIRQATEESGVIAGVMTSLLPAMLKSHAAQVEVIGARLRIIVAVRTDTMISPASIKVSLKHLVAMAYETTWGPPTAKMTTKVIQARRALITQSVDGAFIEGRFTNASAVELDLWLPEDQAKLMNSAKHARLPSALSAATEAAALPSPPLNPFTAAKRFVSSAEAKFVGLAGALAMWNLVSTLKSLHKAQGETGAKAAADLQDSLYGVVSGVLAVGATIGEVIGKVTARRVTASVAKDVATRLVTRAALLEVAGGLAAMGAAWTTGIQDFAKAYHLAQSRDSDSAALYGVSGVAMLVSGFASAATVVIAAGGALQAASATGTLASLVISAGSFLGVIPVWGWIALGLVTLVAGIYLAYKAMTREDTPLEIWLSRCWYRNTAKYAGTSRTLFANSPTEMAAFQNAVYGLQITLDWDDSWFESKDDLTVQVVMPGYGPTSDYAFALQTSGGQYHWGWNNLDRKTSVLSSDPDLKPHQQQLYFSAVKPGQKLIPMDEVLEISEPLTFTRQHGAAMLAGKFKLNPHYLDHARLKFQYWPDAASHPELEMTPAANGIDFKEVHA